MIAVLLIGIGYATLSNEVLTISGSASATTNDNNFTVKFTGEPTTTTGATAKITDDITAEIGVTGLTAKGDKATATYTIVNGSPDLSADLAAEVTKNTNTEYFTVTPELAATNITATGDTNTTTLKVTVELIKTPISGDVSSQIEVQLTATPVQPGTAN